MSREWVDRSIAMHLTGMTVAWLCEAGKGALKGGRCGGCFHMSVCPFLWFYARQPCSHHHDDPSSASPSPQHNIIFSTLHLSRNFTLIQTSQYTSYPGPQLFPSVFSFLFSFLPSIFPPHLPPFHSSRCLPVPSSSLVHLFSLPGTLPPTEQLNDDNQRAYLNHICLPSKAG